MISPYAVISPNAKIGTDAEIGAFCVIEDGVEIGDQCQLAPHTVIRNGTRIGKNNRIESGCIIGGLPQHITAQPPFGNIVIGSGNTFRENVTIHRAVKESAATLIGNNNYLMVNAHIAHDCVIGNNNVLVNNTMLGGHVQVGSSVTFGGGSGVHQFCRIGSLAMLGAQSHVVQDIPPFMMVDGLTSRIVGLNLIGLRRNGRTAEDIKTIKSAYMLLYRSGLTWAEILDDFQNMYAAGPVAEITQFILETKRGIVSERHSTHSPLRMLGPDDNEQREIIELRAAG
ncbi:MAG: acyl-ACP--UDP-N-acetylglucosamine O-acyltransferase [Planctomycetaceae bacterium]|jgi:UDP-N-acetylglucosamine acyltransferase|nr:acyl-ACP--UDP-N-acetylglucosamine O-acyltransferase [Planctomycetaceae bacterium]